MMTDRWAKLMAEHEQDGARDAERGYIDFPYPGSDDPQEQDENRAYQRGFNRRRKELGEMFEWQ